MDSPWHSFPLPVNPHPCCPPSPHPPVSERPSTLLHPPLLLCSFLYSFTPHPPSVVPSSDTASFISRHAVQFPHQNELMLSLHSSSPALPSIVFRHLHVPLHAPKTSPSSCFMWSRIFSLPCSLFTMLVSLNCLRIYNLAPRKCVWVSSADKICIRVCSWTRYCSACEGSLTHCDSCEPVL